MKDSGRPLPRHRAVTCRPEHDGRLTLTEEHDRELRRGVRSARLRNLVDGAEVLPLLRDAIVIWIGENRMTIMGFEWDPLTRRSVARSWYVEILSPCQA